MCTTNTFDFRDMLNGLSEIAEDLDDNLNTEQFVQNNYQVQVDDPGLMNIDSDSDKDETGSIIADAPEDEQEYADLLAFFKTKRCVIDILYDHIFKNNAFVTRWKGRLSRENRADVGKPILRRRGNFGDVEYACYEAWVKAHKVGDHSAMINAVKNAMKNEAEENELAVVCSDDMNSRKRRMDDNDLYYGDVRKARYN